MSAGRVGHVVVTCEHATPRVPEDLRRLFRGRAGLLRTHRGWDIGALGVAERLAGGLAAPLFLGEVSRLVIELNRSLDSGSLFSEATRALGEDERRALVERYYTPWRSAVREHIERAPTPTLHLSVHSFTPVLAGKERRVEIGLLFDPARAHERRLCERWRREIERDPAGEGLRVRMNLPYRGTSDGHTTALRAALPKSRYMGVEVEVRNTLIASARGQGRIGDLLTRTLRAAIAASAAPASR